MASQEPQQARPASGTVFVHTASPARHATDAATALAVACPVASGARDDVDDEAVAAALARAAKLGAKRVVLHGGDVLQRRGALALLGEAKKSAAEVEVWTQAAPLLRPEVCAAIRRAGASHVGLPMYGDSAEGHDYIAGTTGHFQRTLRAAQAARSAGLQVVLLAPLLRPTFRGLQGLVQKCVPAGISALRVLAPAGPDRDAHPLLVPLAMSAPHLRAAMAVALAGKLPLWPVALPICVTGLVDAPRVAAEWALATEPGADDQAEYGPACDTCAARSACPGQSAARAAAHGWVGLVPPT